MDGTQECKRQQTRIRKEINAPNVGWIGDVDAVLLQSDGIGYVMLMKAFLRDLQRGYPWSVRTTRSSSKPSHDFHVRPTISS